MGYFSLARQLPRANTKIWMISYRKFSSSRVNICRKSKDWWKIERRVFFLDSGVYFFFYFAFIYLTLMFIVIVIKNIFIGLDYEKNDILDHHKKKHRKTIDKYIQSKFNIQYSINKGDKPYLYFLLLMGHNSMFQQKLVVNFSLNLFPFHPFPTISVDSLYFIDNHLRILITMAHIAHDLLDIF